VGEKWPAMKGKRLDAVLRRLCGEPLRQSGSHRVFKSHKTGLNFVFSYHDSKEVTGDQVRRILVTDVGLSKDEARKEVR
jgi:predicted RNA binding protein YcfA (HicA-like mRNA interferase family)